MDCPATSRSHSLGKISEIPLTRTCHDRDSKFGRRFAAVAASSGIKELRAPVRAPKTNAICERIIGSLKREYLDHMLIWHRSQVRRLVKQYAAYYILALSHQGIEQPIPDLFAQNQHPVTNCPRTRIISKPILGGLHHQYHCTSWLN